MSTTNQYHYQRYHLSLELPQAWTWELHANNMASSSDCQHYDYDSRRKEGDDGHEGEMREHLFEKPLTPSDVGKLNRLVIPKQHAERHFPLDGEAGEKGLLLSFEDESGKAWRFRYSYWTSSQSYVLTKGWSRFVKEKRLHAGDVVHFERRRHDAHRLYIRWKRRAEAAAATNANVVPLAAPWSPPLFCAPPLPYCCPRRPYHVFPANADAAVHQESHQIHDHQRLGNSPPATSTASTNSRTLRLFGVNLECALGGDETMTDAVTLRGRAEEFGHRMVDARELHLLPSIGFSSAQM